eukprot:jgi/Astpho2/2729/fgenesh1_pm.00050_%23_7_t
MSALDQVAQASQNYPKAQGFTPSYGTAGFRAAADMLPPTVFRCGLLMAARSMQLAKATGICITASHNPARDNGVKLVDPSGNMLSQAWEVHADELARSDNLEQLMQALLQQENIVVGPAHVLLAHDTRASAESLMAAAVAGALGAEASQLGLLTTPQLHWMVQQTNLGLPATEEAYFETLASSFALLVKNHPGVADGVVHVDCANGVGGLKLQQLQRRLASGGLQMRLHATGDGELNGDCGADFVQKERGVPAGFPRKALTQAGARCASIDGDADRLVYFSQSDSSLRLFDGDRIAVLAALLIHDLAQDLPQSFSRPKVGMVQTAYANGAGTHFITDTLGLAVACTPTGVKHLHGAAEKFDIGIYFEANGHGTVLFQRRLLQQLQEAAGSSPAAADLLLLGHMVNQAVGDAISGLLLVEVALRRKSWSMQQWAALYNDLPSRQLKVQVANRAVVKTADAEWKVIHPEGLQASIDQAVKLVPSGRSFVRPSGTEDVVRVYAEAQTQQQADDLAKQVACFVSEQAGGVS